MEETRNKTVMEILEDVSGEICKDYCKYQEIYQKEDEEDRLYEHCDKCPLNKLI